MVCHLLFFLMAMVVLLILLFVVILWKQQPCEHYNDPSSCIITLTTFMGFEDRARSIVEVLDPLVRSGQEIIVINEWNDRCQEHVEFMKTNYPYVKFIQKTLKDKGQARSLNILIRDYLLHSDKKYWVHWEDTWTCTRPLFPEIVRVMDANPQVSQLQLTNDWNMMPYQSRNKDITILKPLHYHEKTIYDVEQIEVGTWPLFSLRPSINRLSFFQRHGRDFYFMEDPNLWPLRFEWEFGRIFLRNKGIKAVANKPFAKRINNHKSTYSDLFNKKQIE